MLLRSLLSSVCLSLLLGNAPKPVEGRYVILPRQNSPSPTTTDPRGPLIPTSSQDAEPAKQSDPQSTLATSSSAASATSFPGSDDDASSTFSGPAALAATPITNSSTTQPSGATNARAEELPVPPRITPALSVAGTILILTGLAYTLVGIKTKWLHIFLSTAYLTSLATTVLIVYVMHPPVSNAIQGAYFVAAFVTGLIFGGGSVIFADVTEGLGCLLGGYCLAMWFLVLTPGGLIKSTAGKAIFIACLTLGAFGLYLSHWTRAYGLIGAISFAGATVIVLGIDCFSRAGLKEFWLYIWDLNENVFPLHYTGPYPQTRGVRVEIAAIIIIFLIGVMSQMRIWKVIRQRREERAAERSKREQLEAQAEEDLGKRVEEGNSRDRAVWEATYGRKNRTDRHVDSGVGTETPSVGKASLSIVGANEATNSTTESFEMNDLEQGTMCVERKSSSDGKGKARATAIIRVASDEDIVQSNPVQASTGDGADPAHLATDAQSSRVKASPSSVQAEDSVRPQVGKGKNSRSPEVVPLPFHVPTQDPNSDRRSSMEVSIASEHSSTRVLNRLSGSSIQRTSSQRSQRSYVATSTHEEALMLPLEDDRASSVEATVDEVSDEDRSEGIRSEVDGTTLAGLPSPAAEELLKFSPPTEPHPVEQPGREVSEMGLDRRSSGSAPGEDDVKTGEPSIEKPEAPADYTSPDANHDPQLEAPPNEVELPANSPEAATPPEAEQPPSNPGNEAELPANSPEAATPPNQPPSKPAFRDSLADLQTSSRVAMAYRTNEWAKHLDRAEKPSLDELPSIRRAESTSHATPNAEKVAPVDVPALQQTPLNAAIPPPNLSSALPQSPSRTSSLDSLPSHRIPALKQQPLNAAVPPPNLATTSSVDSLPGHRTPAVRQIPLNAAVPPSNLASTSSLDFFPGHRTPARQPTPLNTAIPPSNLATASPRSPYRTSSLDSLPSQRTPTRRVLSSSSLLQHRNSHHSPLTSTPTIAEDHPSTFPPAASPLPTTNTLMSRRESMLQKRASSTSIIPRTHTPSSPSTTYLPQNNDDDDNVPLSQRRVSLQRQQHQHQQQQVRRRSSSGYPFPAITATASMNQEPQQPHLASLLRAKRRSESELQRARFEKRRSEGERDARWRDSGAGMEERHREAMRRMQAKVGGGEKI